MKVLKAYYNPISAVTPGFQICKVLLCWAFCLFICFEVKSHISQANLEQRTLLTLQAWELHSECLMLHFITCLSRMLVLRFSKLEMKVSTIMRGAMIKHQEKNPNIKIPLKLKTLSQLIFHKSQMQTDKIKIRHYFISTF